MGWREKREVIGAIHNFLPIPWRRQGIVFPGRHIVQSWSHNTLPTTTRVGSTSAHSTQHRLERLGGYMVKYGLVHQRVYLLAEYIDQTSLSSG